MAKQGLTYEEHEVGAAYESLGRTVTEADICAFVNLCGFNEPLFYDMEYVATSSVFKGKPAPGAFTFCLSEGLVMQTGLIHGTGMSYLGSDIRIVSPVLVGDTLHVRVVITDKRETKKADRGIVTYRHEVLNHRGELVLEATIKRMIKRAAAAAGNFRVDQARIVQINISPGGVPKLPVPAARVTGLGIEGDLHRETEIHGGPERALCMFPMEQIRALQAEGHTVFPGAIGENLTVEGLDWERVTPGSRIELGAGVLIEVTRYTSPCVNIKKSFADGDFSRVSQKSHPGSSRVYARVLREGTIRQGDTVKLVDSPPE